MEQIRPLAQNCLKMCSKIERDWLVGAIKMFVYSVVWMRLDLIDRGRAVVDVVGMLLVLIEMV